MENPAPTTPWESSTYPPLQKAPFEIRLLRLLPNPDASAPVVLELRSVVLADVDGQYTALSYAWGDPTNTAPVTLNGHIRHVTANLQSALLHLRHGTDVVTLWADALCINQDDDEEKSNQVQQMGRIYSFAKLVAVWLGEAGDDSDFFLRFAKAMDESSEFSEAKDEDGAEHPLLSADDTDSIAQHAPDMYRWVHPLRIWDTTPPVPADISRRLVRAMVNFVRRDWWSRLWVVQEVLLAREVVYRCGWIKLSEDALRCIMMLIPLLLSGSSGESLSDAREKFLLLSNLLIHRSQRLMASDETGADSQGDTEDGSSDDGGASGGFSSDDEHSSGSNAHDVGICKVRANGGDDDNERAVYSEDDGSENGGSENSGSENDVSENDWSDDHGSENGGGDDDRSDDDGSDDDGSDDDGSDADSDGENEADNSLRGLLLLYSRRQTTNPVDKVYALLGLADDREKYGEPNYSKHYTAVFAEVARIMIESEGNLNLLRAAGIEELAGDGTSGHLSWAPDWSRHLYNANPVPDLPWRACGDEESDAPSAQYQFHDSGVLVAVGILVDTISVTSSVRGDALERQPPKPEAFISDGMAVPYIHTEATRLQAYFNALTCYTQYWRSDMASGLETVAAFLLELGKGAERSPDEQESKDYVVGFLRWSGLDRLGRTDDEILDQFMGEQRPTNTLEDSLDLGVRSEGFYRHVRAMCNRDFGGYIIETQTGFFGLASDRVREGDVVCVIFGCDTPLILRQEGDHWRVVQSAYVYGLVEGEAIQRFRDGKLQRQEFRIL